MQPPGNNGFIFAPAFPQWPFPSSLLFFLPLHFPPFSSTYPPAHLNPPATFHTLLNPVCKGSKIFSRRWGGEGMEENKELWCSEECNPFPTRQSTYNKTKILYFSHNFSFGKNIQPGQNDDNSFLLPPSIVFCGLFLSLILKSGFRQ